MYTIEHVYELLLLNLIYITGSTTSVPLKNIIVND